MNEEPDPEQIDTQPKPFNSVAYWLLGVCIFMVVSFLVALFTPIILCGPKNHNRTQAINNAKQIGLALFSFEDEYGSYPSDETKSLVNENNPDQSHDLSGNSSNAAFRQLMKAGITESEQMFYAKINGSVKPDNNITPNQALIKGEVGFSYISGISSKNNPKTPIVLTPLIPGTAKFDPKPFKGKALVLHIDNSVTTYKIKKDGTIHDKDGNILSPNHPFWNGKAPTIHYPE